MPARTHDALLIGVAAVGALALAAGGPLIGACARVRALAAMPTSRPHRATTR